MEKPDVVVGTPSRVLAHLKVQNLVLDSSLEMLVVDEADLVFSFGFEADLKNLLWWKQTRTHNLWLAFFFFHAASCYELSVIKKGVRFYLFIHYVKQQKGLKSVTK